MLLYSSLPSIDKLLKTPEGARLSHEFGHTAVVNICRQLIEQGREYIKNENKLLPVFKISAIRYVKLNTSYTHKAK